MKLDTRKGCTWVAMLPGGRRTKLRLARGVRLCVGDILRIGRKFYTVVRRESASEGREFVVQVADESREARSA